MNKFSVIEFNLPEFSPADVMKFGVSGPKNVEISEPLAKITKAELTASEVVALKQKPRTMVAPEMAVRLIDPVKADDDQAEVAWGIQAIGADNSTFTGKGCNVCVLDTGIDSEHPAFSGQVVVEHKDFTGEGGGDQNGHGTHVAGTICGRDVDGNRIGVAKGVTKILDAKVLGQKGGGSSLDILQAIQWAVDSEANIISMSLGIDFPGQVRRLIEDWDFDPEAAASQALTAYRDNIKAFEALVDLYQKYRLFGKHVLFVAASGNESKKPSYSISSSIPAASEGIISVGAAMNLGDKYAVAPFSNVDVDVTAPGFGILSAKAGGGVVSFNGTSMACPHVSGVAAMLWEKAITINSHDPSGYCFNQLQAMARNDVFADEFTAKDFGHGFLTAP